MKDVPQNFQIDLLEKYQKVTKEQVLEVLEKYFLPLFKAESSVAVAVTAPSKSGPIAAALAEHGFDVDSRSIQVDAKELEEGSESSEGSEDDDSDSDHEGR